MKIHTLFKVFPSTFILAMSLVAIDTNFVQAQVVNISSKLPTDPLILTGQAGGSTSSNCGRIGATPHQVLNVTEPLPYLRLTVESGGQPTLLIDGPGGRFCVLADSSSGEKPEMSGFWQKGKYLLYIGDLSPKGEHQYTLSISQQQKQK